jgi:tight adherence protein B
VNDPAVALLLLLATLVVAVIGVRVWWGGYAQRAATVERARLAAGLRTRRRVRGALEQRLRRTRAGRRLENRLAAAGLELGVTDFVAGMLLAITAAFVVVDYFAPAWVAAVAGAGAARGSLAWIDRKRRQRAEAFAAQLPELARVLSNASSAGLSLPSAIGLAISELEDPAASELAAVGEELRLGQSVDLALERLQERMPSREVGVLVATLVIQQRAGGDLVRSLRDMADTLEARKDLKREVRTIMAGAVFTSYIVAALGVGTILMLNSISPGAIDAMFASGPGRLALIVAGSCYALGFFLIRRTTRIET